MNKQYVEWGPKWKKSLLDDIRGKQMAIIIHLYRFMTGAEILFMCLPTHSIAG